MQQHDPQNALTMTVLHVLAACKILLHGQSVFQPDQSACVDCSQAEESHAPPPGPHGRTKESKMGLLQSTPGRQAASAGTGMLFALRSMAIRMSPVLSSYVSHQHAEDQSVNGQGIFACNSRVTVSHQRDLPARPQLATWLFICMQP